MFTLTASSLAWLTAKITAASLVVGGTATVTGWFFDGKGGKRNARKSSRSPRQRREYSAEIQRPERETIEQ
jgi:hypothetical protein